MLGRDAISVSDAPGEDSTTSDTRSLTYNVRMAEPYLARLTARLADGLVRQPAAFRSRHTDYLRSCQNDDGGFAGRDPASDLYYTAFALPGLALLDALERDIAEHTAGYLRLRLLGSAPAIDFFSLLYAAALVQLAAGLTGLAAAPAAR